MEIKTNIKTTNLKLNSEINKNIDEKVEHLKKFISLKEDEAPILDIELENKHGNHHRKGFIYRTELNFEYNGQLFRTESEAEDLLVSFNDAHDEMVRRIRKNREKKTDLIRKGAKKIKKMMRFGKE